MATKKQNSKAKNNPTRSSGYKLPTGIKRIMKQDILGFQATWKCGHVTEKDLLSVWTQNRIDTWINKGILVNRGGSDKHGHRVLALTAAGEKLCKKHPYLKFEGTPQAHSKDKLRHNLAINRQYWTLTPEQRETSKTEADIRRDGKDMYKALLKDVKALRYDVENAVDDKVKHELEARLHELQVHADNIAYAWETREISTPDFSYVTEGGKEVYFEVITNQYSEAEISAKINFSNLMNTELILHRI